MPKRVSPNLVVYEGCGAVELDGSIDAGTAITVPLTKSTTSIVSAAVAVDASAKVVTRGYERHRWRMWLKTDLHSRSCEKCRSAGVKRV